MFFAELPRPWKCQTTKTKQKHKTKKDFERRQEPSELVLRSCGQSGKVYCWVQLLRTANTVGVCSLLHCATTRINRAVYNKYTRRQRGKKVKGVSVWQMGNPVVL